MAAIYLDVIWLENFCMDLWILFVAGWLGKWKIPVWRTLMGAGSAACLSLAVFVPVIGDPLSSWYGKLILSALIVLIAFPWRGIRLFAKQLAFFYLASFLTGGVVLAVSFFTSSSFGGLQIVNDRYTWSINLGLAGLLGSLPLVFFSADLLLRTKRRQAALQSRVSVHIRVGDKAAQLQAIVDTGNTLVDPFNHEPVSVAVGTALASLLSPAVQELFATGLDPVLQLGKIPIESELQARIRIIPYRGVGGKSGMLMAFAPDEWWISSGTDQTPLQGLIALQAGVLCHSDTYQMILHPESVTNSSRMPAVAELKGAS